MSNCNSLHITSYKACNALYYFVTLKVIYYIANALYTSVTRYPQLRAVATGTASTAMAVPLFDQVPYKFERVIFVYNELTIMFRNISVTKLAISAKAQLQRLNTQYFARIVLTRNKILNVLI